MSTVIRKTKTRAICPYLILGLERSATRLEVETAYWRLQEALDEGRFLHSPQAWVQAGQALMEVENAYQRILQGDYNESDESAAEPFWPKLGQILIAAGKINIRQLHDAIAEQEAEHQPLGEILKKKNLISEDELSAFLSSQDLIHLPDDSPYISGLRLIGLRIVPEDMVCIALIEYCDFNTNIESNLMDRGWLSPEVLDAIKF
ncbi:MAG: hypothetical protein K2X27_17045 [Candidatus Obscuribacterales bacterium]|nr:hypothetical protein [Candidatus Obscuribacterales bacterium]